ncbi:MAG: glycosyltransferase family 2 protein [Candidatus Pacebacteria bacterium]|nr:glycosyltransferase family 2 protein [Candidatus Paceibacterota bacterium]
MIVRGFFIYPFFARVSTIKMVGERKPPHIGRASDLEGSDRVLYRFFEMIPAILAWSTILGAVILSYFIPVWMAFFIIAFDIYWLLKTIYLSIHLRQNWKRMKFNMRVDWQERLRNLKHGHLKHLIIYPYYKEGYEVIEKGIQSLINCDYDAKKFLVVLAPEERAGKEALEIAESIREKYGNHFDKFHIAVHPDGIPGEMAGKGSNIAYAIEDTRVKILDANNISYKDVVVSAFDIDTVVYPKYFSCLTWYFLTTDDPYRTSFQPVPLYNNNIWDAPSLSRVVASSGTFWQMIQQERPEKLATFSSHSVSFQALYEIGYWQKNMVSEDSRIYWNALMAYDGDYKVQPLSYPVSMDANLAPSFFKTSINIYKQQRRWGWGVENVPYILYNFVKNKKIRFSQKIRVVFTQLEGFWSLSTNPLLIFLLGWLPVTIGSPEFKASVLSFNLPIFTRNIMILAMAGLIISAIISLSFLPKRPEGRGRHNYAFMFLQWILIPVTITIFGALPGLDAQTRLMFGKYMGFWVTPKEKVQTGGN